MSPVVGGSKIFWTEFIKTYESLPELWDVKSDCYKNRNLKNEAYEKLVIKLQEIEPKANREIVRRKINSLRCSYRRELNKIKGSRKIADVDAFYCTSLWYFDLLRFLREHENLIQKQCAMADRPKLDTPSAPAEAKGSEVTLDPDPTPETAAASDPATSSTPQPAFVAALAPPPPPQPPKDCVPPPVKKFKSIHQKTYKSLYSNPYRSRYQTAHDSPPPPQQNQRVQQDQNVHICSSCPCIAAQESEYDKIGKAWASELQKMSPGQQIYAKRAIAEIIFEGQLGSLHRDSVIINHIDQRVADESSPIIFVEKEEPDFDC